jgi:FkbM family methyltransferase
MARMVARDVKAVLGRVGRRLGAPPPPPSVASSGSSSQVTEADIRAAYRLLLNREADPDGLEFWRRTAPRLNVGDFVGAFTDAREFQLGPLFSRLVTSAAGGRGALELIEVSLPGRQMLVDAADQTIGRAIRENRDYEPHLTRAISSVLPPGSRFLDIGANVGWFALLAASLVGPSGVVVAVEAHPVNADVLSRSRTLNGLENILVLPVAASDRVGTVQLQSAGGSNAAIVADDGTRAAGDHFVTAVPLDDLRDLIGPVDVMKVDTEGAEYLALRGASQLVAAHRPEIFFEFSPGMVERLPGSTVAGLQAWIVDQGYALSVVGADGAEPLPVGSLDEATAHLAAVHGDHLDIWARPGKA